MDSISDLTHECAIVVIVHIDIEVGTYVLNKEIEETMMNSTLIFRTSLKSIIVAETNLRFS